MDRTAGLVDRHAFRRVVLAAMLVAVLAGSLLAPVGEAAAAAPAREVGTADWRVVSAGTNHTCGIRISGRLYCWGMDFFGVLGDGGANTDQPAPVEVSGGATDWLSVSAGYGHTCGIRSSGRLYCWGYDAFGQLGDGGANLSQTTPVEVFGGNTSWTSVTSGENHTCARRSTGRLFCWGYDVAGQVGDGGTNAERHVPIQVFGHRTTWAGVSAGRNHTCARRVTGRLFCWGSDSSGQVGDGFTSTDRAVPVQVLGGATDWTSVDAGLHHTCGRRSTGRVFCWGDDSGGQLGDGGANTNRQAPRLVSGGFTDWASVSTGTYHTCGRRTSGRLLCWGSDQYGQLGDGGPNIGQPAPVQVFGATRTWTSVTAGQDHTCARKASRRLYCWGRDASGQVGDGAPNTDQAIPTEVA